MQRLILYTNMKRDMFLEKLHMRKKFPHERIRGSEGDLGWEKLFPIMVQTFQKSWPEGRVQPPLVHC